MTTTEQIAGIARTLPEPLARQVLDFLRFLQARARGEFRDWQEAQAASLAKVWNNPDDAVWNDVLLR